MIYNISTIRFEDYFEDVRKFCVAAIKETTHPIIRNNFDFVNYKTNPASFLHKLYVSKKILLLTLIYDGDIIVGSSGVEEWNPDVGMIGRRLFILKSHRNKCMFYDNMWLEQKKFCEEMGYKIMIATQEDHLKALTRRLKRGYFLKEIPEFNEFVVLPKQYLVNNTLQWICCLYVDNKYNYKSFEEWLQI